MDSMMFENLNTMSGKSSTRNEPTQRTVSAMSYHETLQFDKKTNDTLITFVKSENSAETTEIGNGHDYFGAAPNSNIMADVQTRHNFMSKPVSPVEPVVNKKPANTAQKNQKKVIYTRNPAASSMSRSDNTDVES